MTHVIMTKTTSYDFLINAIVINSPLSSFTERKHANFYPFEPFGLGLCRLLFRGRHRGMGRMEADPW